MRNALQCRYFQKRKRCYFIAVPFEPKKCPKSPEDSPKGHSNEAKKPARGAQDSIGTRPLGNLKSYDVLTEYKGFCGVDQFRKSWVAKRVGKL